MTNWDLSTEKLKPVEIKRTRHYNPSTNGCYRCDEDAVAQAQIEKSKAYQAQQTGDIQEKIRGKTRRNADIMRLIQRHNDRRVSNPEDLAFAISTLLSQELKERDERELYHLKNEIDYTDEAECQAYIEVRIEVLEARLKEINNER